MSSPAQTLANRRNARRSTGPVTEEGRAAVSLNARRLGLYSSAHPVLPGENTALYEEIRQEYYNLYRPATARERSLVEEAVSGYWRLKRCAFLETGLLELGMLEAPASGETAAEELPPQLKLASAFRQDCASGIDAIEKLSRVEARVRRAFNQAVKELEYVLRHQKSDENRQGTRALPEQRRIEPLGFFLAAAASAASPATDGEPKPPQSDTTDLTKQSQFPPTPFVEMIRSSSKAEPEVDPDTPAAGRRARTILRRRGAR